MNKKKFKRTNGENYKTAAIREFKEESEIKVIKALPVWDEIYQTNDGKWINRHVYYAIYDGVQKIVCHEGQKIEFIFPSDFPKMLIYPGHDKIIAKALKEAKEHKLL